MSNLENAIKNKIRNASDENKNMANEKCLLAKSKLEEASETTKVKIVPLLIEAFDFYSEAVELNSKQINAYHGLSFISFSLGHSDRALYFLSQALYFDPENNDTKQMIEEVKRDIKDGKLASIISKHAGKTLSQSIAAIKADKSEGLFAKLTSLFTTKIIKKSGSGAIAASSSAINQERVNNASVRTGQGGGDYLSMVREARNQLKK